MKWQYVTPMRLAILGTVMLSLLGARQQAIPSAQGSKSTVYWLEDPMWTPVQDSNSKQSTDALQMGRERRWCAYANEAAWESATRDLNPMETGNVEYSGNVISVIHLEESDESGDWVAADEYALDTDGHVLTLHRQFRFFPESISVDETWSVANGKMKLAKRVTNDSEVAKNPGDLPFDLDHLPRFASLKEFRFVDFLTRRRQSIAFQGNACEKAIAETAAPKPTSAVRRVTKWATWRDRLGWTMEYPRTWQPHENCGTLCVVSFNDPDDPFGFRGSILVESLDEKPPETSATQWLDELKTARNRNRIVGETPGTVDGRPALVVRYAQDSTEMEETYTVNGSATFEITIGAPGKIADAPRQAVFQHMISSFKFTKVAK